MTLRTLVALALLLSVALSAPEARTSAFAAPARPAAASSQRPDATTGSDRSGSAPARADHHAGRRHGSRAARLLLGVGAGALDLCCARAVAELAGSVDLPWSRVRG